MVNAVLARLKPLTKNPYSEIWSFDTETDTKGFFKLVSVGRIVKTNDKLVPFLYEVETFYKFEEFIFFLFNRGISCVYCYNISFDSRFIPNFMIMNPEYDFELIESSSSLLGVVISKDKQKIVIKDFFPYCLTSLEKIAKTMKCDTKKYPVFKEDNPEKLKELWKNFFDNCSIPELVKHCETDVKMLCEVMYKYKENLYNLYHIDILSRKIFSLASLAMKNFRTNFITNNIYNPFLEIEFIKKGKFKYDLKESYESFSRLGYHGGYTGNRDNYRHLKGKSFDINSSYPKQTQDEKFGCGNCIPVLRLSDFMHGTEEIGGFALAKVNFNHEKWFLPVLRPDLKFGRMCGYWEGVLTSHELNWLTEHNISWEFQKGLVFDDWDKSRSLERYCKMLYSNKAEYSFDNPYRNITKMLLNAITGKFGQKTEIEHKTDLKFLSRRQFENQSEPETLNKKINDNCWLTWKKSIRQNLKPYQFVNWIAAITAKGRIQLTEMIIETNANYWDTDSVYCDLDNCKDIVSDEKTLGGWKKEHSFTRFRALAPKMYCFYDSEENKHYVKCKGLPRDFFNREMFNKIWNFSNESVISVHNIPRFLSMKESFGRVNVLERDLLVMYDEMSKTLKPECKM